MSAGSDLATVRPFSVDFAESAEAMQLRPNGWTPNNARLPVLVYRSVRMGEGQVDQPLRSRPCFSATVGLPPGATASMATTITIRLRTKRWRSLAAGRHSCSAGRAGSKSTFNTGDVVVLPARNRPLPGGSEPRFPGRRRLRRASRGISAALRGAAGAGRVALGRGRRVEVEYPRPRGRICKFRGAAAPGCVGGGEGGGATALGEPKGWERARFGGAPRDFVEGVLTKSFSPRRARGGRGRLVARRGRKKRRDRGGAGRLAP